MADTKKRPPEKLPNFNGDSLRNLLLAAFCCCMGSISFGYVIGYSSPAVPDMEWQGILEKSQLSWFSSIMAIGAIFGSLVAGTLLEQIGRKQTIIITIIPFTIGWLSIMVASVSVVFYFGRFLTGFATGIISTAVPVYLAEISTKDIRGLFAAFHQLGITFGILVVYALGLTFRYSALAFIGILFPLICAVTMIFIPETPRWLIIHKSRQEAKAALVWFRQSHSDVDHELSDMEDSNDLTKESQIQLADFVRPELRKALTISVGLMLIQQFSGINAVMFNIVDMFLDAGFRESGELAAVIVGIVQFLATGVSCLIIDRWGRRPLLIFTGLTMAFSCLVFSYYYHVDESHPTLVWKYVPLFSLSIFIIAFSLGWGPVPSLMMSEVFSTKARGIASSLTVLANWSFAFIITKNYSHFRDTWGKDNVFSFFAVSILIGVLFVYHFVPETKGKSLEDIELYFLQGRSSTARGRDV